MVRISQMVFKSDNIPLETFHFADSSCEVDESKFQPPQVLGNLTVSQYVLRKDGIDTAQWIVSSEDGKLVLGPFQSLALKKPWKPLRKEGVRSQKSEVRSSEPRTSNSEPVNGERQTANGEP
jgi:hypothetical protein